MSRLKPSVDLGYPTEAHGRIPAFANIEEEAAFWDTHDVTDFIGEELELVELAVSDELKNRLILELDRDDQDRLAQQAEARGVSIVALAELWLKERLDEELQKAS